MRVIIKLLVPFFAVISWIRVLLMLPVYLQNFLRAKAMAADAEARLAEIEIVHRHTEIAWRLFDSSGTDFRPLGRRIVEHVIGPIYGVPAPELPPPKLPAKGTFDPKGGPWAPTRPGTKPASGPAGQ